MHRRVQDNPSLDIFAAMPSSVRSDARAIIIELVLATDLKTIFGYVDSLNATANTGRTSEYRSEPMNVRL